MMPTGNDSRFQPGDRVYFIGWNPTREELPDWIDMSDVEAEAPRWGTVAPDPGNIEQDRTPVAYDEAPSAIFPAANAYLVPAADAPVPDPRQETTP